MAKSSSSSSSSKPIPSPEPEDGGGASASTSVSLGDKIEATVQQGGALAENVGQAIEQNVASLAASTGPSRSIASITQPEQAIAAVKQKVSELHKLVNDIGHVAAMPVHAVQALIADIQFLTTFIHSRL